MLETTRCQVCHSEDLVEVLDLGLHPLCDDLVPIKETRTCQEYPIKILLCPHCLTANQHFNVTKLDLFSESYHYRSRFTQDVLNGMKHLVEGLHNIYGSINNKKVMDVGCNDGSLLSFFAQQGAVTYGVEPTGAYKDIQDVDHVFPDYFGKDLAEMIAAQHGKMDYITFTNVFAHIEDFDDLISGVQLLSHENTKIVIENHFLGAVLQSNQFDTFYHEHPRTYSLKSFDYIAERLGMNIEHVSFPKRYGGNIRVIIGNDTNVAKPEETVPDESTYFEQFKQLQNFVEKWRIEKRKEIESIVSKNGPLIAKAFPGRAAILIKMLNLTSNHISCVAEKPGSMKIGHFLPGTRIPIVSDDDVDFKEAAYVLNLAWHIKPEISNYLAKQGFQGERIDIL